MVATKPRPKPSVNGNHRRTLPVLPAGEPPAVQTSAPSATPADPGRYEPALPIDRIQPSASNPRKTFDEVYLGELAASIREVGLIEPILVRPLAAYVVTEKKRGLGSMTWRVCLREDPQAKNTNVLEFDTKAAAEDRCYWLNEAAADQPGAAFELVVGECRWRAHKIAGLETIAATVRNLTDRQAAEIQLVENLQRKNVDPIEEAEGFQALLDRHGYTAETLAEKVGKSKAYIYAALKMLAAPPKCLERVRKGEVSPAIAQLFGRIPGDEARKKAWDDFARQWSHHLTVEQAKSFIGRECMVELKGAPFDAKDATLTSAGSCAACPKRTGNAPELFPEARADVCTDPGCYRSKVEAHGKKAIAAAEAAGAKVLRDKKLFNNYSSGPCSLAYNAGFVELDDNCYDVVRTGGKPRTYRTLLGDAAKPTLAIDPKGVVHEVVSKESARRILKEKKLIKPAPKPQRSEPSPKEKLDRQVAEAFDGRLAAAVNQAAAEKTRGTRLPAFLRPLLEILLRHYMLSDAVEDAIERENGKRINQLAAETVQKVDDELDEDLDAFLVGKPDGQVVALFAEAMVAEHTRGYRAEKETKAIAAVLEQLGVDEDEMKKKVRSEIEAAAKNGSPKKGKVKR